MNKLMQKSFDAKTLTLLAVAAWAAALLIVAALGLGGRFTTMPLDAAPAKPIPDFKLTPASATMGPLNQYAAVGQRPLLNFDRKPSPIAAAPGDSSANEIDVMLTSVLRTPQLQMGIFRETQSGVSRRVRLGEIMEGSGWRLTELDERSAVLEGPSGQKAMDLRVFDGKGGEPVTVLSAPAQVITTAQNPGVQAPQAAPAPVAAVKPMVTSTAEANDGQTMTQEQQIEAIRQRIAARRAQMQSDAARAASEAKK
jgi:general secretion pathway protein N